MSWEYRVVREQERLGSVPQKVVTTYILFQTYKDSVTDAMPQGETREEFLADFQAMAQALTKPVLAWQDGRFVEVEPPIAENVAAALEQTPEVMEG